MSKPEAIEYKLNGWSLDYSEEPYETSSKVGASNWLAEVRWVAIVNKQFVRESVQEYFTDEQSARAWIAKETV